ncbi:MAG: YeeE/YedE family protein [Crocinitomicaceae bacterium]|nr:YeeE/YedE family protein [Crocinitomicaceae bacterium]
MDLFLPWYIAGPLLGLTVPILLIFREKQLGISSSLKYVSSLIAKKIPFLNYQRKQDLWQIQFVSGVVVAGVFFNCFDLISISQIVSDEAYSQQIESIYHINNWLLFLIGGIFVGFGARYANGCTAGHGIMGVSQLSLGSVVTTVCFFLGGLLAVHFVMPLIEVG